MATRSSNRLYQVSVVSFQLSETTVSSDRMLKPDTLNQCVGRFW
jgi:hypothetical protein